MTKPQPDQAPPLVQPDSQNASSRDWGASIDTEQLVALLNMDKSLEKMCVIQGRTTGSETGSHCAVTVHVDLEGNVG